MMFPGNSDIYSEFFHFRAGGNDLGAGKVRAFRVIRSNSLRGSQGIF